MTASSKVQKMIFVSYSSAIFETSVDTVVPQTSF